MLDVLHKIDLCRAVDYLETRPEIDKERISYAGGSMRATLGVIFIGVEPRIKAAALIVARNMSLMVEKSKHYTVPAMREYLYVPTIFQHYPCNETNKEKYPDVSNGNVNGWFIGDCGRQ